jgi:hypothetical protein
MTPRSSYFAVVARPPGSSLSQPRLVTSSLRSAIRPCLDSRPAVALPLLYSMRSGASSELSTMLAVFWICSKPFSSNSTFTPGCAASNFLIASAHALPMALSAPS